MKNIIPMSKWGRDHWSTFAYIGSIQADRGGRPTLSRMRCHPRIHTSRDDRLRGLTVTRDSWSKTRLKDGSEINDHDDWSCVDDMEAAGLVEQNGTGLSPILDLTPIGWEVYFQMQKHIKCNQLWSETFEPDMDKARKRAEMERKCELVSTSTPSETEPLDSPAP